ncbi:hypothetical protein VTO73DRAFT_2140 [Trametes versicolor]
MRSMAPPHEPYQDRAECANPNPSPVPSTSPASAIGQVLDSPELLRAIFNLGFLEPGRYSHDDDDSDIAVRAVNKAALAALAACARVSRHFSQHALDVLWFSLDGNIEDLLRILPSIQLIEGETMITGDITSAEWAHFCTYTTRVKEISYNTDSPAIDPLIWTVLVRKCQGESLFPRMRLVVVWLTDGSYDVPALLCFLSPSLRVFDLRIDDPTGSDSALQLCASVKMVFQILVDIAPNLTDLRWETPCDRRFGVGFLARIGCLRSLRTLRLTKSYCPHPPKKTGRLRPSTQVPAAEITLLRALAAIPPLRYLHLDIQLAELDREMKAIRGAGLTFQELRTLHVVGGGPAGVLPTLVHSLSLPALQCLVVDHDFDRHVALAVLENQLSKLCAKLPLTLQILKWINLGTLPNHTLSTAGTMAQAPSVMSSVLGPLLRFTNLSHVEVELCMTNPLQFTDDGVVRLATAWPNIQTLHIIRTPGGKVPTESISTDDLHPTITALVTFAQCCPKLSSLTLHQQNTKIPDISWNIWGVPGSSWTPGNSIFRGFQSLSGAPDAQKQDWCRGLASWSSWKLLESWKDTLQELPDSYLDFSSIRLMTDFPLVPRHPLKHLSVSVAICGHTSPVQITVALDRLCPELDVDRLRVTCAHSSGTAGSVTSDLAFQAHIRENLEALQSARKREKMHVKLLEAEAA